jgi:N-terminal acetyltransferase B complex catalytic subunit
MSTIRSFEMFDLLKFNNVNLDVLTETFYTHFWGTYFTKWQEYCVVSENSQGRFQGWLLGKIEGDNVETDSIKSWHGHVSGVTVAPEFRRQGLARVMMDYLEEITTKRHNAWFVDLFVRASNSVAIGMYEKLGYIVYRRVLGYYSGGADEKKEDALDMRKAMPRDKNKETVVPLEKPIMPHELEY